MIAWLATPGVAPFSTALLVMFGLTAVELFTLFGGVSLNDLVDEFVVSKTGLETLGDAPTGMETTSDGPGPLGRFLAWLYVGRVPVLMVLIVFLTVFGLAGVIAQSAVYSLLGRVVPGALAGPAVFFLCLPVVRLCTGGIARLLPKDETSAVSVKTFVGQTALMVGGTARSGLPAQARFKDAFGTEHYLLVEPEDAGEELAMGTTVLIVRETGGGRFSAIPNPNAALDGA